MAALVIPPSTDGERSGEEGHLPFTRKKETEIPGGKSNGSAIPYGKVQKTWAVILGNTIFLLFLVCSADLDRTLWRVVLPPRQYAQHFNLGGFV